MTDAHFELRPSASGGFYVVCFLAIVLIPLTIFDAVKTQDWSMLYVALMLVALCVWQYISDRGYRISIQGQQLSMQFFWWSKAVKMQTSEIAIVRESGSGIPRTIPRIWIVARGTPQRIVEIDPKRFSLDDIRRLMQIIHEARPDLSIPDPWLNQGVSTEQIKHLLVFGTAKQRWLLLVLVLILLIGGVLLWRF